MIQRAETQARRPDARTAGDVLRGLLATAAIAAFVIGVPTALMVVAPVRVPTSLPTWSGLIDAVSRPDDGTLLLGVVTVIAWLAWLAFALPLVIEIVSSIRGVRTPHLPSLGHAQRLAAGLVATAGLLMTTPVATASAWAPSHQNAAPVAPQLLPAVTAAPAPSPTAPVTDSAVAPAAEDSQERLPSVTVLRGDTLWDLAERHLGSGHRYAEIRDLNLGRLQPDGRALTDAHWIYPGWRLLLPADAVGVQSSSESTADATAPYRVDAGDTLWEIAAEELGDPLRYAEIVDLNVGCPQPDGEALRDPDLIRPGWVLELPATPAPIEVTGPSTVPSTDDARDDGPELRDDGSKSVDDGPLKGAVPHEPGDDAVGAVDEGAETTDDAAPGRHLAVPPVEQADVDDGDDDRTTGSGDQGDVEAQELVLGLTALAATGIVGELARRRRMQQRVRRVGRRIPLPVPGSSADDAERTMRAAVPPITIPRLKASFLDLATRCYEAERDLPRVGAVTVTPSAVVLHLTEDDDGPVKPYTASDARTWMAPHEALPDTTATEDSDRPEPFPALVTLGHTSEGTVLVNLEAAGTLTIAGDEEAATEILRALVAELATSDLTGRIGLVASPEFEPLAQACDPARLQIAPVEAIALTVDRRLHEVRRATADAGVDDTLQARSDRIVGDVWLPVVFVTTAGDAAVAEPWSGSAVVAVGSPRVGDWTLTADGTDARLRPLEIGLAPQRLTLENFDRLVELLTVAAPRTDGETLARREPVEVEIVEALAALPAAGVNEETSDDDSGGTGGARSAVRIGVLGPITIDGLPGGAGVLSRRSTELLVYLALRGRATGPELDEALWYGARVDKQTRNSLVYRTRQRVGAEVLPVVGADGIYRLGDSVTSDWAAFQRHARRGLSAGVDRVDNLRAAMDLVRDRPLLGVRDSDYTWAEHDIQHMISAVADVAHVLSRLLLEGGDARAALEVATKGLAVDQSSELLLSDALEAAILTDDATAIDRLRARLADDIDVPLVEYTGRS
ncbi:LysM peptidoglycan-binding domain-containing protein [Cellulomonas carbonis]|uniref:LysM domain-containing protein n=1 Tax=Cellulomonas carbonis T26 TaxID=947969 RepID=A0A0A0BXY4_9CELL|nr:LysM peptidoglycan-binding domain-containing protein [Cellulomonas carbonis]KGM12820.1 hypothetical protein N868_00500 [Cellulomonas carbonis T26]GGC14504.1 hypothetical protein GCM10010972_29780 [Cellulomonas carbonis]